MIEKPKRPKKPDIQERQPPRTLQELVNRYDLDNTKVYDFLDGLVELLNTEKDSIDTSINDLSNKKVNKSGDTMTGDLNMQNNSVKFGTAGNIQWKEDGYGDKFRIIPDFGNIGANNKLIIQSTTGEAGTDPQNWKDLVYIHADSGEVELAGDIGTKNQIIYDSWHNVILTRTDQMWLTLILYGSNLLKKGNYSIANDFKLTAYGTSYAELTIPRSAIKEIIRKDWGFELLVARSEIQGNVSGELNGVAIAHDGNLVLQST